MGGIAREAAIAATSAACKRLLLMGGGVNWIISPGHGVLPNPDPRGRGADLPRRIKAVPG